MVNARKDGVAGVSFKAVALELCGSCISSKTWELVRNADSPTDPRPKESRLCGLGPAMFSGVPPVNAHRIKHILWQPRTERDVLGQQVAVSDGPGPHHSFSQGPGHPWRHMISLKSHREHGQKESGAPGNTAPKQSYQLDQ